MTLFSSLNVQASVPVTKILEKYSKPSSLEIQIKKIDDTIVMAIGKKTGGKNFEKGQLKLTIFAPSFKIRTSNIHEKGFYLHFRHPRVTGDGPKYRQPGF